MKGATINLVEKGREAAENIVRIEYDGNSAYTKVIVPGRERMSPCTKYKYATSNFMWIGAEYSCSCSSD